jgi:hypothetical protein
LVALMASRLEEPGEVVQLEAVVGADVFPCGQGELKRGESSDDVTSEDVMTELIWGRADVASARVMMLCAVDAARGAGAACGSAVGASVEPSTRSSAAVESSSS